MTGNNLTRIYSDFRTSFEDSPDFTITFFVDHSFYLNAISSFEDKEDLRLFIELTWQHLNATYRKSRYTETLELSNKRLLLIERELTRLKATDLMDDWYYGVHYFNGMAQYNIGAYRKASAIFNRLMKYDEKNERFRQWFDAARHRHILWLLHPLWIVWALLIFAEILFKQYIPQLVGKGMMGVGLVGMSITWGLDYYFRRKIRKEKRA